VCEASAGAAREVGIMSFGPVSGNGIPIVLPTGKTALWSVIAQSSGNQYVQLKDSGGNVIFTAQGASSSGGTPTQIGQGSFTVDDQSGNYTMSIGVNGGSSWSTVLWDDITVSLGQNIMCSNFNFIAEDATDQDFNDSAVSLTWFNSVG
jgi:mannose-binding lectin